MENIKLKYLGQNKIILKNKFYTKNDKMSKTLSLNWSNIY